MASIEYINENSFDPESYYGRRLISVVWSALVQNRSKEISVNQYRDQQADKCRRNRKLRLVIYKWVCFTHSRYRQSRNSTKAKVALYFIRLKFSFKKIRNFSSREVKINQQLFNMQIQTMMRWKALLVLRRRLLVAIRCSRYLNLDIVRERFLVWHAFSSNIRNKQKISTDRIQSRILKYFS